MVSKLDRRGWRRREQVRARARARAAWTPTSPAYLCWMDSLSCPQTASPTEFCIFMHQSKMLGLKQIAQMSDTLYRTEFHEAGHFTQKQSHELDVLLGICSPGQEREASSAHLKGDPSWEAGGGHYVGQCNTTNRSPAGGTLAALSQSPSDKSPQAANRRQASGVGVPDSRLWVDQQTSCGSL